MQVPHRKSPNRIRELREQVYQLVRLRIGAGVICARCRCTFATMNEKCEADLDERCPGFNVVDLEMMRAEKEVGLVA